MSELDKIKEKIQPVAKKYNLVYVWLLCKEKTNER